MAKLASRRRGGFTLIELLVVVLLMMIMMGTAMFAFLDLGRGAKMRAAVLDFRTAFLQARQHSITYRVPVFLIYGNVRLPGAPTTEPFNRGYYVVKTNLLSEPIGMTNYLAEGVLVSNVPPVTSWVFRFRSDGSCTENCDGIDSTQDWVPLSINYERNVKLYETGRDGNYLCATVRVIRMTGAIAKRSD